MSIEEVQAAIESEIVRLHKFFSEWFQGATPKSEEALAEHMAAYLTPSFAIVNPKGHVMSG